MFLSRVYARRYAPYNYLEYRNSCDLTPYKKCPLSTGKKSPRNF